MARIDKSFSEAHQITSLSKSQAISKKMPLSQKGVQGIISGSMPKSSATTSLKGRVTSVAPQGAKRVSSSFSRLKKTGK